MGLNSRFYCTEHAPPLSDKLACFKCTDKAPVTHVYHYVEDTPAQKAIIDKLEIEMDRSEDEGALEITLTKDEVRTLLELL